MERSSSRRPFFVSMKSIIITAGGIGKRMGSDSPKQFLEVSGKPILMHTINRFYAYNPNFQLVLTLPEEHVETWKNLCDKLNFQVPHTVVCGGRERFHSVQNALAHCTYDFVGVHDGVRPFVSDDTLSRLEEALKYSQAVIPVLEPKESLRILTPTGSQALVRSDIRIVQTPQFFKKSVLITAYQQDFKTQFTDDASVVEAMGIQITMVNGNSENIKITEPVDLRIAQFLMTGA
jgi:2-C-methyl-D-erythritol 4-phosphate cytidylyltransferase